MKVLLIFAVLYLELCLCELINWHEIFLNHFTNSRKGRNLNTAHNIIISDKTSNKIDLKIVNNEIGEATNNGVNNNLPPYNPNNNLNQYYELSETLLFTVNSLETLAKNYKLLEKRVEELEALHFNLTCPKEFVSIGKHCYAFIKSFKTIWKKAGEDCAKHGSELLTLSSVEKAQLIIDYVLGRSELRGKSFWLNGLNVRINWIWVNTGQPISYENELHSNFIQGDGNCLALTFDKKNQLYLMKGTPCNYLSYYICEKVIRDK